MQSLANFAQEILEKINPAPPIVVEQSTIEQETTESFDEQTQEQVEIAPQPDVIPVAKIVPTVKQSKATKVSPVSPQLQESAHPIDKPRLVQKTVLMQEDAEIVNRLIRARRISDAAGVGIDVVLKEMMPLVSTKRKRINFKKNEQGLITGADVVEEI